MRLRLRFGSFCLIALVWSALSLAAAPAAAQSYGVRAGASVSPDQFFFGGHVETPPLADRLYFRPNVEIGIGNDVTVVAANFEFIYKLELPKPWGVYAGAGPALNVISDIQRHSEGGFNFLVGVEHEGGFFAEVKTGVIDSARFKVTVGYSVKR